MNLQDLLSRDHIDSTGSTDNRTEEKLIAEFLAFISGSREVSGSHDGKTGFMKLSQLMLQNEEFSKAIRTVIKVTLLMFPVKSQLSGKAELN